jgi:hypothetical protein
MRIATAFGLLAAISLSANAQVVVPGVVVVADEDSVAIPGGGTGRITSLNSAFSNANNQIGFTGGILINSVAKHFVWFDSGVVWHTDMGLPTVLSGAENWSGYGNGGEFVYSPSIDGGDGIWSDQGLIVHDDDPAPGIPGMFITFGSRPTMLPNGTAHWMSGITNVQGGTTQADVIYRSTDRTVAGTTVLFQEGGMIGGFPTDDIVFDYDVSDNGEHLAMQVSLNNGGTTADDVIALDSVIVAQEGMATGGGDNWQFFDLMRVNNDATIVFSGDTNGATTSDEFIAVDGVIALREGDVLGSITLGTTVRGLALRNDGFVVWAWTTSVGTTDEVMFIGQASNLAATSQYVVKTGDGLDTNGDTVADYTVVDFEFTDGDGQGAFDFTAGTMLFTTLELAPAGGGANITAQVGIDLSAFLPTAGAPGPAPDAASLAVAPNPFGDAAQISITLAEAQPAVTVEVLDVLGRRVALIHEGPMAAGTASLSVDARQMEAGVYVVRATAGDWSMSERITRF